MGKPVVRLSQYDGVQKGSSRFVIELNAGGVSLKSDYSPDYSGEEQVHAGTELMRQKALTVARVFNLAFEE